MHSRLPSVCLPAGDRPFFRGTELTGNHLDCRCGRRLIENYDEDAFIRVSLYCFACDTTTETPGVPSGETLPLTLVNLGAKGDNYAITETIDVRPGGGFTSDHEILEVQAATAPRMYAHPAGPPALGTWLTELTDLYDEVTGGRFGAQSAAVSRHQANGETGASQYPFAWAVAKLRQQPVAAVGTRIGSEEWTAHLWLIQFEAAVRMWSHHPRFGLIGETIGTAYLHTTAQLIAAASLHNGGARIGFPSENLPGQGNPDMYVRRDTKRKLYIEVKAPLALQPLVARSMADLSSDELEKIFRKTLKKSGHQINRARPGYVLIASALPIEPEMLNKALHRAMGRAGRSWTSLAGLMALTPTQQPGPLATCSREFEVRFQVLTAENLRTEGDSP